jgi:glycosyltransferase involved in cell wall biosynthesis
MKHTIGIAIPVLNGEKYLKDAIESALNQTVPADEILVFIHDTKDTSRNVAEKFLPRVRIAEENTNLNIGQAWNRLYELSKSDYVVMLHDDDTLELKCIELIREKIISNPSIKMIFGGSYVFNQEINQNNLTIKKQLNFPLESVPINTYDFKSKILKGFLPGCSGLCLHRDTMLKTKFNERLSIVLDCEFFTRSSLLISEVAGLQKVLANYRVSTTSTMAAATTQKVVRDYQSWMEQIDNSSIQLPVEVIDQYRGFVFRRLASFYSSAIYDNRLEIVAELQKLLETQIFRHDLIFKKYLSKSMLILIKISLLGMIGYYFAIVIARVDRILKRFARYQYKK